MSLFSIAYFAVVCGLLAWVVQYLDTTFHRLLFGLCTGAIAATAMPFIQSYVL